jgi:glycosyltransferase involved in cell wall biosynthesis
MSQVKSSPFDVRRTPLSAADAPVGVPSMTDRGAVADKGVRPTMQVLHVSSGNLYGGVETALVALARFRHLCPAMQPEFALSFEGRLSKELLETGVRVHQLGEVRARKPWTVWSARANLRALLAEQPFDVVMCHMAWPMAMFGSTAQRSGKPLAFWAHDAANGSHWLERWARRVTPDIVIGNSQFTKGTVPLLFPNTPCKIVFYPVMPVQPPDARNCRAEIRRELGASNDTVAIIQVSRMEAWKGHHLHLDALAKLKDDPRWTCWMVGGAQRPEEQKYMREIQEKAIRLGVGDRVRFLGQRSDVPSLLAAADIFCQPNLGAEPFGIVFIEALAAGLPVVTTAMGGPQEIIDESCGLVAPPGDADQVAASLRRLIDSPELRTQLGQQGPERARDLCDPAGRIPDLYGALAGVVPN